MFLGQFRKTLIGLIIVTGLALMLQGTVGIKHTLAESQQQSQEDCSSGEPIRGIDISSDGKYLIAPWNGTTAHIWDIKTGSIVFTLDHPSVRSVSFSENGKYVATANQAEVIIWEFETKKKLHTLDRSGNESYPETHARFTPDNKHLFTGDKTGGILWDVDTGELIRTFPGNSEEGVSTQMSLDGNYVLTFDQIPGNATWNVWDLNTGEKLHTYVDVWQASFTPDSKSILTNGLDGLLLWNVDSFDKKHSLASATSRYEWVFSPNSQYILALELSSDELSTLVLWDLDAGKQLHTYSYEPPESPFGFFSQDSEYLFVMHNNLDENISVSYEIWTADGSQILKITEFEVEGDVFRHQVLRSTFNDKLIAATTDGTLGLWDLNSGMLKHFFC